LQWLVQLCASKSCVTQIANSAFKKFCIEQKSQILNYERKQIKPKMCPNFEQKLFWLPKLRSYVSIEITIFSNRTWCGFCANKELCSQIANSAFKKLCIQQMAKFWIMKRMGRRPRISLPIIKEQTGLSAKLVILHLMRA
jgi:hypothetical protein